MADYPPDGRTRPRGFDALFYQRRERISVFAHHAAGNQIESTASLMLPWPASDDAAQNLFHIGVEILDRMAYRKEATATYDKGLLMGFIDVDIDPAFYPAPAPAARVPNVEAATGGPADLGPDIGA